MLILYFYKMLKAVTQYEGHSILHYLLKAILRGRSGCQKNLKSMLGGEKLSDRRKAKTLELNRAA